MIAFVKLPTSNWCLVTTYLVKIYIPARNNVHYVFIYQVALDRRRPMDLIVVFKSSCVLMPTSQPHVVGTPALFLFIADQARKQWIPIL